MNQVINTHPFDKLVNHISKDFTTVAQIFIKNIENTEGYDP
jgi:hypothetical protein